MNEQRQTVSDVGELELLRRIRSRIGAPPPGDTYGGDDTAVFDPPGRRVLLTTDMMVEGLDFELSYSTAKDIGWKAIAINASDIASMCGRPSHAVAAVALRLDVEVSFVDGLLDGMLDACDRWGIALTGGDLSGGVEIAVTVAMVGAPISTPVHRSGARPGDAICVTGALGGSAAGLLALRRGMERRGPAARVIDRHLRPTARVDEAACLAPIGPTAMIDISDGLAVDLANLLEASGAGCSVQEDYVPVDPDITGVPGIDPLEAALTGGEDFELLFTMSEDSFGAAQSALDVVGTPVTRIGTVTDGDPYIGLRSLNEWRDKGWEHLRTR